MGSGPVHFELFVRHRRGAWALELATADRRAAFEAANQALASRRDATVRLCKETRDPATGDYRPLVLLERDATVEAPLWRNRRAAVRIPPGERPSCTQPRDLYASPAREAIGRFLVGWLARHRVTPFELLHRADLAERLEACEAELSAALYNAALADAAARGVALEPIRRGLDDLARRTIERITGDDDPDVGFRLGVAVASRLGRHANWKDKLELVLDLLETAPEDGEPASVASRVLQQPLIDILGAQGDLDEIFGPGLVLGDQLLILIQIASAPALAAVAAGNAALARSVPRLKDIAARLALVLHARPAFARARRAIGRRLLAALASDQALWPDDLAREVEGLKALSALLAVSGRLIDQETTAIALAARWRHVSDPVFIDARLALCKGAVEEVGVVLDLLDAAVGRAPLDALGRRLAALLSGRAFEQEARFSPDPLAVNLRRLAGIARRIGDATLRPEARAHAERRLRRLAAALEADAKSFSA